MLLRNRCVAAATAAFSLFLLSGCGGGGNSNPTDYDPNTPYTDLTRAMEEQYDYSARVLALPDAKAAQRVFLSVEKTALYDADIKLIRSTYPQVKDIVARPVQGMSNVIITIKDETPWQMNWYKAWGNTSFREIADGELATGEQAVDAVLNRYISEYALNHLIPVYSESKTPKQFSFSFGRSLNMTKVAEQLRGISPYITEVKVSEGSGDGDNIARRANSADGSRNYTFSDKWGDCDNGCRSAHDWNFTVSPDGKSATLIGETGSPLSEKPED